MGLRGWQCSCGKVNVKGATACGSCRKKKGGRGSKYGEKKVSACKTCGLEVAPGRDCPKHGKFIAKFASRLEYQRFLYLLKQQELGKIDRLTLQPEYELKVNDKLICKYVGDFLYFDYKFYRFVVEDTKSTATKTRVYSIKRKLMYAIHNIKIKEVTNHDE